jgi:hypothetical protein
VISQPEQSESTSGLKLRTATAPPELTKNEIELVRFIRAGRFDWDAYLAERSTPSG